MQTPQITIWKARTATAGSCGSATYFASRQHAIEWVEDHLTHPEPELEWYQAAHRHWRCEPTDVSDTAEVGMLHKVRLRDAAGIVIDDSFTRK